MLKLAAITIGRKDAKAQRFAKRTWKKQWRKKCPEGAFFAPLFCSAALCEPRRSRRLRQIAICCQPLRPFVF